MRFIKHWMNKWRKNVPSKNTSVEKEEEKPAEEVRLARQPRRHLAESEVKTIFSELVDGVTTLLCSEELQNASLPEEFANSVVELPQIKRALIVKSLTKALEHASSYRLSLRLLVGIFEQFRPEPELVEMIEEDILTCFNNHIDPDSGVFHHTADVDLNVPQSIELSAYALAYLGTEKAVAKLEKHVELHGGGHRVNRVLPERCAYKAACLTNNKALLELVCYAVRPKGYDRVIHHQIEAIEALGFSDEPSACDRLIEVLLYVVDVQLVMFLDQILPVYDAAAKALIRLAERHDFARAELETLVLSTKPRDRCGIPLLIKQLPKTAQNKSLVIEAYSHEVAKQQSWEKIQNPIKMHFLIESLAEYSRMKMYNKNDEHEPSSHDIKEMLLKLAIVDRGLLDAYGQVIIDVLSSEPIKITYVRYDTEHTERIRAFVKG